MLLWLCWNKGFSVLFVSWVRRPHRNYYCNCCYIRSGAAASKLQFKLQQQQQHKYTLNGGWPRNCLQVIMIPSLSWCTNSITKRGATTTLAFQPHITISPPLLMLGLQLLQEVNKPQCGHFMIFLLLSFYVKSILEILKLHDLLFRGSEFWFLQNFCTFWRLKLIKLVRFRAPDFT